MQLKYAELQSLLVSEATPIVWQSLPYWMAGFLLGSDAANPPAENQLYLLNIKPAQLRNWVRDKEAFLLNDNMPSVPVAWDLWCCYDSEAESSFRSKEEAWLAAIESSIQHNKRAYHATKIQ